MKASTPQRLMGWGPGCGASVGCTLSPAVLFPMVLGVLPSQDSAEDGSCEPRPLS